jgi:hypothetical protein
MFTAHKLQGAGGVGGGDPYWFNVLDVSNFVYNNSIATDSSNNTYVGGQMIGTSGVYCPFIAKYDADGALIWSKKLGDFSGGGGNINCLAIDSSDNVIASGDYNDGTRISGSLIKIDPSGNALWHRIYYYSTNSYHTFREVGIDASDNIYVCGKVTYSPYDMGVVLKFNSAGTLQWQRQTTGGAGTFHSGLCVSPSGDVYVGGYSRINTGGYTNAILLKLNTSGALQFYNTYGFPSADNPSGGYFSLKYSNEGAGFVYISGYERANPYTDLPSLVFKKIQTNGTTVFSRKVSYASNNVLSSGIVLDSNQNAYLSFGLYQAPSYIYTMGYVKYSSSGVFDFARELTGYTLNAFPRQITVNSNDTLQFVTGAGTTDGTNSNGLTLKVPNDGSLTGAIGSGVNYSSKSMSESAAIGSTQPNLYSLVEYYFTLTSATTALQDAGMTTYTYPL